jgi:chromosome segregation ATPase
LTEIHELIGSSHAQTRAALEAQLAHFDARMQALSEASATERASDEALSKLSSSLAELREGLAHLQTTTHTSEAQSELLQRLDALAESQRPAEEASPVLTEILQKLTATHESLDSVRKQAAQQTEAHESVVSELRAEIEQLRSALQEAPKGASSSVAEEAIASLRAEIDTQRQLAEEARQQAQKQETERALLEAELDRVRTQAAQWKLQQEQDQAHHHEEEQKWHEELQDLRQLVRQATAAMGSAPPQAVVAADLVAAKAADGHDSADPVASSLLAQFAKLQKDSARRRTRSQ